MLDPLSPLRSLRFFLFARLLCVFLAEGLDGFLKIVRVDCLEITPQDDNSFFDILLNLPDDTSMAYVKGLVYGELNKRDKAIQ